MSSSQVCLGGTCDATWPAGGGGSVSTSSAISVNNFPFWSSSTGQLSGTSTLTVSGANLFAGGTFNASGTITQNGVAVLTTYASSSIATTAPITGAGSITNGGTLTIACASCSTVSTSTANTWTATQYFTYGIALGTTTLPSLYLFTVATSVPIFSVNSSTGNVIAYDSLSIGTTTQSGFLNIGTSTSTQIFNISATGTLSYDAGTLFGNMVTNQISVNTTTLVSTFYVNGSSTILSGLVIGTTTNPFTNSLLTIATTSVPIFSVLNTGNVGIGATTTIAGLFTITANNATSVLVQDTSGNYVFQVDSSQTGNNNGIDITAGTSQS